MNNNVRLGVEAVLVIVLIIALFLYFSQQQELTDAQAQATSDAAAIAQLNSSSNAQATEIHEMIQSAAEIQMTAEGQANAGATAIADVAGLTTELEEAQAAAEEQANVAATAMAESEASAAQIAEAQSAADAAASAQAEAEQQVADLQATIDAMNAATPEPEVEATEEATAEAQTEATEEAMVDVTGFPPDVFSMEVGEDYTTYNLTGDAREASMSAITAADDALATRLGREASHDYAAVMGAGEYVLINQQALPAGVTAIGDVADVALRRADSSEVVTLGENEVARGMFGENEVRYILVDGGSLWVLTFVSANVAGNLEAFDAIVATFDAVEPPAEEESSE